MLRVTARGPPTAQITTSHWYLQIFKAFSPRDKVKSRLKLARWKAYYQSGMEEAKVSPAIELNIRAVSMGSQKCSP